MGIYLVSVGGAEWFDESENGQGEVASALNDELVRRALPRYDSVPEQQPHSVGRSGWDFEEKLVPSMSGFLALCEAHLSQEESDLLLDWTVLVPLSLDEQVLLPIGSSYAESTVIAGAPQVLAVAERLAAAVGLPVDVPSAESNLDLTMWFLDGKAKELAAVRPGLWSEDLDAAFYVALYLRAAQHCLRHGCPMAYS